MGLHGGGACCFFVRARGESAVSWTESTCSRAPFRNRQIICKMSAFTCPLSRPGMRVKNKNFEMIVRQVAVCRAQPKTDRAIIMKSSTGAR